MFRQLPTHTGIIGVIWFEAFRVIDWQATDYPAAAAAFRAGFGRTLSGWSGRPGMRPLVTVPLRHGHACCARLQRRQAQRPPARPHGRRPPRRARRSLQNRRLPHRVHRPGRCRPRAPPSRRRHRLRPRPPRLADPQAALEVMRTQPERPPGHARPDSRRPAGPIPRSAKSLQRTTGRGTAGAPWPQGRPPCRRRRPIPAVPYRPPPGDHRPGRDPLQHVVRQASGEDWPAAYPAGCCLAEWGARWQAAGGRCSQSWLSRPRYPPGWYEATRRSRTRACTCGRATSNSPTACTTRRFPTSPPTSPAFRHLSGTAALADQAAGCRGLAAQPGVHPDDDGPAARHDTPLPAARQRSSLPRSSPGSD